MSIKTLKAQITQLQEQNIGDEPFVPTNQNPPNDS